MHESGGRCVNTADIAGIVTRVGASRRYHGVDTALVTRLAEEELPRARTLADAEKRVKRRLHQIFGAYTVQPRWDAPLAELAAARARGDDAWRVVCRATMARHASTRERLPILDRFYSEIFALTGPPAALLDLGCGLNPLAISWMGLPPGCRYAACDIDHALVAFVDAALGIAGANRSVEVCDIIASAPDWPAELDMALLLKLLPPLEQQRSGVGRELLAAIPARALVVSYPTRSLGGHAKGMEGTYRAQFARAIAGRDWEVKERVFPGELVFVVTKNHAS